MDNELTIIFLKWLNRKPTDTERTEYIHKLLYGELTISAIEELLKGIDAMTLPIKYDASMHESEIVPTSRSAYDGVVLSNGKLYVKSSHVPFEAGASEITTGYNVEEMSYHNTNTIHGFKYSAIKFVSDDDRHFIKNVVQRLNMHTAFLSTSYTTHYPALTSTETEYTFNVTHEQRALQQYPYCFLNSVVVTNVGSEDANVVLHHVHEPSGYNLADVNHALNIVNNKYIYVSSGVDKYRKTDVHAGTIYKFSATDGNLFNISFLNETISKLALYLKAGESISFHAITCMMSTHDFLNPPSEIQRILLNIYDDNLVFDHNQKWLAIWNTGNITLSKKNHIPNNELSAANENVELYQRNIKFSLYNIFTLLRNDVNVDMNVLNLSAVDKDGEIFWNAEMFLIPVLLILNPSYAKVLLDFRYKQMEFAKNVASVYKRKGCQYPYKEDISRYKDVFWSPDETTVGFNTALVGINTWNYYKVTQDKYWLTNKGYPMLQNCARFFASLFDRVTFQLKAMRTIGGDDEENNALTRYLAITVMRYYIEASYEILFQHDSDIKDLYDHLKPHMVPLVNEIVMSNSVDLPNTVTIRKNAKYEVEFVNTLTNNILAVNINDINTKKFKVRSDQSYTIHMHNNVFVNFYDKNKNKTTLDDMVNKSVLYSTEEGFSDGHVEINGLKLCTIEIGGRLYPDVFIITDNDNVLNNLISRPSVTTDAIDSPNKLLETHMILMHFYSRMLFKSINPVSKVEMIKDNLMFYKPTVANTKSNMIMGNLQCLLAQELGLQSEKKYYIDLFDKNLQKLFSNENDDLTTPWGNHNEHILFVFNVLTSMLKFRIKGSISDKRLYTEPFAVEKELGGSVMPKFWGSMHVTFNSQTVTVPNSM